MAKKTKDSENEIKKIENIATTELPKEKSIKNSAQTASTSQSAEEKVKTTKSAIKKTAKTKTSTKKSTGTKSSTTKASTKKSAGTKSSTTKSLTKKSAETKSSTTKTSTKKSAGTKSPTTKTSNKEKSSFQAEYYDLPFSYNKTVVKILAQTPTTLFVYWEISEDDRNTQKETYGENFFEVTKPVLILYNDTLNYSFEIEINDFANSWYIHVNDSKCDYRVELGRKIIPMANIANNQNSSISSNIDQDAQNQNSTRDNTSEQTNIANSSSAYIPYYVYITSSNEISAPNDKILLKKISKVTFRNIKTGQIKERNIKEFKLITNYGIMNLEEIYKYLFPNEDFSYEKFLKNPSSGGLTSSRSFSSQFK